MQKALFTVTAALEVAAGLALLRSPSVVVSLLLGASLDGPGAATVARIGGAALLALGLACWLARADGQGRAARGLLAAMLLYNSVVVALLAHARLGLGLGGSGIWPAALLHSALGAACLACLRARPARATPTNGER